MGTVASSSQQRAILLVPGTRHTDHSDLVVPTGGKGKEHPDYIRNPPGQGTSSKSRG